MGSVAIKLIGGPAASAQSHPVSNLISFAINGNNRNTSSHPDRATDVFCRVLDQAKGRFELRSMASPVVRSTRPTARRGNSRPCAPRVFRVSALSACWTRFHTGPFGSQNLANAHKFSMSVRNIVVPRWSSSFDVEYATGCFGASPTPREGDARAPSRSA